jgi:steroid 5-alpha reductase family enzyme
MAAGRFWFGWRNALCPLLFLIVFLPGPRVYAEDLVVAGSYRHVRNPMRVGNVLILLGVALASDSWACVLVAVPLFLGIYTAIVAAEEEFLAARFGPQYEQFVRTVPRWTPRLRGIASTLRERPFHSGGASS